MASRNDHYSTLITLHPILIVYFLFGRSANDGRVANSIPSMVTSERILSTATSLSILHNAGFRRFIARASGRMDSKVREHTRWENHMFSSSVADPVCLYRIPDLKFSIPDPG
jgi:hypothetical protein